MTTPSTLSSLLLSLQESISTAATSLPESAALAPPTEGISLFDTKNELLLSYLQNLVFLIILKIRTLSPPPGDANDFDSEHLSNDVIKKLVELRVYLERGVRPLEGKLKYQLNKLVSAASEADAAKSTPSTRHPTQGRDGEASASDEDAEPAPQISDLSYRPNPSAFMRPTSPPRFSRTGKDGIYKPPRITPTALPTTEGAAQRQRRPRKSATVDDFIREEMTDAPLAEPSIGAGTGLKGREKERDEERREYEEQRLVRLPGEKKRRRTGGGGEDLNLGYGGLADVEFGDLKPKRKKASAGVGGRVGERWERRVKQGLRRKRR